MFKNIKESWRGPKKCYTWQHCFESFGLYWVSLVIWLILIFSFSVTSDLFGQGSLVFVDNLAQKIGLKISQWNSVGRYSSKIFLEYGLRDTETEICIFWFCDQNPTPLLSGKSYGKSCVFPQKWYQFEGLWLHPILR